jgi:hypothetical protein
LKTNVCAGINMCSTRQRLTIRLVGAVEIEPDPIILSPAIDGVAAAHQIQLLILLTGRAMKIARRPKPNDQLDSFAFRCPPTS